MGSNRATVIQSNRVGIWGSTLDDSSLYRRRFGVVPHDRVILAELLGRCVKIVKILRSLSSFLHLGIQSRYHPFEVGIDLSSKHQESGCESSRGMRRDTVL